jgi:cytochrome c-type biogenesis protein
MDFGVTGLAFLAGLLTVLSPCVLPLLPIVFGAAASAHRLGPVALAAGVAISFVAIGLFIATIGFSIGLDATLLRSASAVLLVLIGFVLIMPPLQPRVAVAAGPVSNWAEHQFGGLAIPGIAGQFCVGLLLGAVWSPCVGPTLGAASVLAAQGKDLGQVALSMLVFGIGAALPLLGLGLLSWEVLMRWRNRLHAAGAGAKRALGVVLIVTGISIASGLDKTLEEKLVAASPAWLTKLTTRF